MIVIVYQQPIPMLSASASSACSKHASGARTVPAPICPILASLWAIPVLMSGVMPVSTTRRMSSPRHAPGNPAPGSAIAYCVQGKFPPSLQIPLWPLPPAPTKRVTPGAAIIAAPPNTKGSVIALSPISGSPDPARSRKQTLGRFTGAVNQRSPSPLTRIPNILPLRVIAVTMLPARIIAPASIAALQ